ncbi:hypothetical protein [Rummeliibacillus pycnus]|uniref:hypothetical protein n=1 Tax=Rummeliibacillus pycnus TaxID=101070 RepID=UPI003D274183
MKRIMYVIFLFAFGIILAACSEKEELLTRVDVQKVNEEGNYEDVFMITDQQKVDLISNYLENVSWEPKTKVEMARKEDILATLFYMIDKNIPEKIYEYRIWFNKNETAIIISNNEKEGFGRLDKENSQNLKNILLNEFSTSV